MATVGRNELVTDVDEQLHFSNRVLAQAEGVGVDFYTINFARYVCSDIQVGSDGQRIFNACLSKLPRYACKDNWLQFGFGEKHMFRNTDVQLYEYEHLLLAAALSEFFSEDYVAAIFSALADGYEDNKRPKPHFSSFKNYVRALNGVLSFSNFPLAVDDHIRLNPYQDHDHGMPHISTTTEVVPIAKVALALQMIAQLKKGQIEKLTLAGGDILGWFSCFVQMFLGIHVSLQDADGNVLYCSNGQDAPLKLMYAPPEISSTEGDSSVLWLREPLDAEIRSPSIPPILSGRVTSESLFSKVFGRAFHILDQTETRTFGNALGGVARVWELLAKDEIPEALGMNVFSDENKADPGTWGIGLIQTWTNWFPELRHLQGRMERALKKDQAGAAQLCQESIDRLEALCGCYICSGAKGSEENPTNLPKNSFCIPAMMETVIMLGLSLSRVTLVPDLSPSRAGILAMYKIQAQKRLSLETAKLAGHSRSNILFLDDFNATISKRLQNIITLFSGSRPTTDIADNLMAIGHEGMCAYVLKLQFGDAGPPRADDNIIRVVMGHINWRQKVYDRLCLGPVKPCVGIEAGWDNVRCDHFKQRLYLK